MKASAYSDIDELKAAEKATKAGGSTGIRDKGGKRSEKGGEQKRRKGEGSCEWQPNTAAWGLSLLAGGATALTVTMGYPLNPWALILVIPGLVGLTHSARLARRFPEADWTVWPLTSAVGMTAGGAAWMFGLSWLGLAGSLLVGLGLALLWLAQLQASAQTVK